VSTVPDATTPRTHPPWVALRSRPLPAPRRTGAAGRPGARGPPCGPRPPPPCRASSRLPGGGEAAGSGDVDLRVGGRNVRGEGWVARWADHMLGGSVHTDIDTIDTGKDTHQGDTPRQTPTHKATPTHPIPLKQSVEAGESAGGSYGVPAGRTGDARRWRRDRPRGRGGGARRPRGPAPPRSAAPSTAGERTMQWWQVPPIGIKPLKLQRRLWKAPGVWADTRSNPGYFEVKSPETRHVRMPCHTSFKGP